MALIQQRVDDLNKQAGAETYTLSFAGKTVEVDLGAENVDRLNELLADFFEAGREPAAAPKPAKKVKAKAAGRSDYKLVRAYFVEVQGETLRGNGAISKNNLAKYDGWKANLGDVAFTAWAAAKQQAWDAAKAVPAQRSEQVPATV